MMNAPNAQAAAAPLPVSAQIIAKFSDLFSDATKDPLQGNYGDLFASFDIDINNAQNGVTPSMSSLRDFIAAAGAQNLPSALGLFSNGVLRPYICPARVDRALGAPASPLDGKLYAFDNDLHRNQGSTVEITNGYFNLVPNTVLVSTVPNILTELAADPALETLRPYANGDANTQVVRSRYLIPIPFKYVNIFLASGITPRRFFLEVYPLMVTDQIEQDCLSLIRFMQITLTVPGPNLPSPIEVVVPIAPPRDTRLFDIREAIIQHHFPALNQSLVGLQQSQIAVQLSHLNQQMARHRADDQAKLADAKAVSLETHYGHPKLDSLLCSISRVANEQGLAPLWLRIHKLKSKKKDVVNLVTELMNEYKDQIGAPHLTVSFNLSMAESLLAMQFDMVHRDSLQTGLNLFLFGDIDEEASLILNNQINLLMSGVTTTLADAKSALKTNVTMPPGDGGSLRYIQRYLVFLMTILPDSHPLIEWLQRHYQDMDSFRNDFATWQHPIDATLSPARGIYHLKWLSNVTSAYFKAQKRSLANVELPDACYIRKQIQNEMAWAPLLSENFIRDYKVKEFCGIYGPVAPPPLPAGGGFTRLPNPPPLPPGNNQVVGDRAGNLHFNVGLFDVFKNRGSTGKFASRAIRYKITNGDLPALPLSKVDGQAMCLPFHVKGMYNQQCNRNADHVEYSGTELTPLGDWCTANYPATGGAGN
jgi:hypothetical protein